jgi:hypothetical protein
MIQEVFISGQIGKVIYAENDRYFVLDAEETEEPADGYLSVFQLRR